MPDVWSGPCAGCDEPMTVPYLDELICDNCLEAFDEDQAPQEKGDQP